MLPSNAISVSHMSVNRVKQNRCAVGKKILAVVQSTEIINFLVPRMRIELIRDVKVPQDFKFYSAFFLKFNKYSFLELFRSLGCVFPVTPSRPKKGLPEPSVSHMSVKSQLCGHCQRPTTTGPCAACGGCAFCCCCCTAARSA